jgi:hypothetical protein
VEENELDGALKEYVNQEFDLTKDLLIKMKVMQTDEKVSVLVFCTHHIIMDGGSLEHFIKTFLTYYNEVPSLLQSGDELYNESRLQFKDYSEWLTSSINTSTDLAFWENYLSDYQPKESFATDSARRTENYKGNLFKFHLNAHDTQALKQLLQQQKTTAHNFLVATLNALIFRLTGQNDICLGTVNSGRNRPELDKVIGMFVKTFPLRTKIKGEQTFIEILEQVQRNILNINDHQKIPGHLTRKIFFDTLVVFQNPDFSYQDIIQLNGAKLEFHPIEVNYSRLPLLFNFFESQNEFIAIITYNAEMYEAETIQILSSRYLQLIRTVLANPYLKVNDISVSLSFETQESIEINFNF